MSRLVVVMGLLLLGRVAEGEETVRDSTCFQIGGGYVPEVDIGSDVAVVYGVGGDFGERARRWRDHGYAVSLMTGIAWGGYEGYFGSGDGFKKGEVQTRKSGRLFLHGENCGYNVPTPGYVESLKRYIEPAVDDGVQAVFLEEPEFWAESGWSEGFKQAWERFYHEAWVAPDSSVDAQYKASRLKYEMYFEALREVCGHAKQRAASQGRKIECHVATHTLVNYAQWRIVSPESHLADLADMDGYIAQVWTGTARTPNVYRGVMKERTFETGFLEYGQAVGMARPTGKKLWFLADPVEDNPNHSWNDYKKNYECTLIASLLWPEVHRYEVMPWPDRIFNGTYPAVDLDAKSGERQGIPAAYATEILTAINALNEMNQPDVAWDTGSRGIGILVSDTLMFQRAAPTPSDPRFGFFYGLALPLVKQGIPLEVVQLENVEHAGCLESCKVLLLTYEGQKPLKRAYHDALAAWVKNGGCLIYVGDDRDPYNAVHAWWNDEGRKPGTPAEALFAQLGIGDKARRELEAAGKGFVRVVAEDVEGLQTQKEGPEKVLGLVRDALKALGQDLKLQNYLRVQRGPFVVAAVMDESVSDAPLVLKGTLVDLFDPLLPVVRERALRPNERALLYDLDWAHKQGLRAKVVAAGARVGREALTEGQFTFVARGPKATRCNARILLPKEPARVALEPTVAEEHAWDAGSSTLFVSFENQARDVAVAVSF